MAVLPGNKRKGLWRKNRNKKKTVTERKADEARDKYRGFILAMKPMQQPENNAIALDTIDEVQERYPSVNCVIYDRCCKLEKSGRKRFPKIKRWPIDRYRSHT